MKLGKRNRMGIYGRIRRAAHTSVFAGLLRPFARAGVFTLELPAEEDGAYDIYYVDGCTRPVLQAIARRYGNLWRKMEMSGLGFLRMNRPNK